MITSLIATFVLGAQSGQLPKLDLSFAAISFRNLVPTIEEQTGWKVKLSPEVENEIIGIRSAGRPTEEILKKIGEATMTSWVVNGEELTVQIDVGARQAEIQQMENEFWSEIDKERSEFLELIRTRKYTEDGEEYDYEPEPVEVIIAKLISNIPVSELRKLQPDERIVYASNPNRLQKPLPSLDSRLMNEIFAMFVKESRGYIEDLSSIDDPEYLEYIKMAGFSIQTLSSQLNAMRPVKIFLDVSRSKFRAVTYSLCFMDDKGQVQYMDGVSIYLNDYESLAPDAAPLPIAKRDGDEIALTPSKEEAELLKISNLGQDDLIHFRMPQSMAKILLKPDTYEPVLYEGGELIHQAAVKRDVPQIVSFSDDIALSYEVVKNVRELRQNLKQFEYRDEIQDGWWFIQPENMLTSWENRVDRRDLQDLTSIDGNNQTLPVDKVAKFAFKYPMGDDIYFVLLRLAFFAELNVSTSLSDDMLRVFGGLSDSQRENLRRGGRIPLNQLPNGVLDHISHLTYGAERIVGNIESNTKFVAQSYVYNEDMYELDFSGFTEPTELFPNGLLQGGYIELSREPGKYLLPMADDPLLARCFYPITREELFNIYQLPRERVNERYGEDLSNHRLKLGDYEELQLRVFLLPGIGRSGNFHDFVTPTDSRSWSILDLPAEIQNQARADYAEIEKTPMGRYWLSRQERGGRTKRDPPPGASDLPANQG